MYNSYELEEDEDEDYDDDERRGLNSDLDTEEEVETMIRFFPNVLSEKDDEDEPYLIYWQLFKDENTFDLKAASFVPLLARLATELQLFDQADRGGLLTKSTGGRHNILQYIAAYTSATDHSVNEKEYNQMVDETCLTVLNRLREMNLLKKEDIQEYNLLGILCSNKNSFFPEKRFEFISDWDPMALMTPCHPNVNECLPIHYCAFDSGGIRGFQVVFAAGMRYFPAKLGFVFHNSKDNEGQIYNTPYQSTCEDYGSEEVTNEVLNRILECCPSTVRVESLLLSLATNEAFHLDGLYLFLRKDPAAYLQLLHGGHSSSRIINNNKNNDDRDIANGTSFATTKTTSNENRKQKLGNEKRDDDDDDDDNDDDDDDDDDLRIKTRSSSRRDDDGSSHNIIKTRSPRNTSP